MGISLFIGDRLTGLNCNIKKKIIPYYGMLLFYNMKTEIKFNASNFVYCRQNPDK